MTKNTNKKCRILVEYLKNCSKDIYCKYWVSTTYEISEKPAFEELLTDISDGAKRRLSFEDENGDFVTIPISILKHCVLTVQEVSE